jgi:hypothetical protein
MDKLTQQFTAFSSFDAMVNHAHEAYRPSLYPYKYAPGVVIAEYKALADAYDSAQKTKGDPRRVYRGSEEWWKVTLREKKTNKTAE